MKTTEDIIIKIPENEVPIKGRWDWIDEVCDHRALIEWTEVPVEGFYVFTFRRQWQYINYDFEDFVRFRLRKIQ